MNKKKPKWMHEYEALSQKNKFLRPANPPTRDWLISLDDALKFIENLYSTDDALCAALRQAEWIAEWSQRPGSETSLPKEADDYPLDVFNWNSLFRRWFSLKFDLNEEASSRLVEIQHSAAEWYLDKKSRPSEEDIREKLLNLKFVKSGEE